MLCPTGQQLYDAMEKSILAQRAGAAAGIEADPATERARFEAWKPKNAAFPAVTSMSSTVLPAGKRRNSSVDAGRSGPRPTLHHRDTGHRESQSGGQECPPHTSHGYRPGNHLHATSTRRPGFMFLHNYGMPSPHAPAPCTERKERGTTVFL
jgi:hypothetical protein